jgi:hypothetical protein
MNMKWEKRFANLRLLGWVALAGLPFISAAFLTSGGAQIFCGIAGALFVLPGFIYFYVLVILHWKDRYRGRHSDLWGVLILIETSGWMKLVYMFRHLLPDMWQSGRYRIEPPEASNLETLQSP